MNRGVRQGSVLSPTLFIAVMDSLLSYLESSGQGLTLRGMNVGCSAHADDVRAASLSLTSAQTQGDLINAFCKANSLKLNASKTELIMPTKGKHKEGTCDMVGLNIQVQREAKCLGVWWRCGCGCVAQKAQTPFTVFTHYQSQYSRYCQTIESVVVSITYLHTQSGESSYLPFTMADIRQSDLPPCIIHISGTCKEVIKHTIHYVSTLSLSLSCVCPNAHCVIWCCVIWCCVLYKVRWVEMNIPYFIRVKEEIDKKNRKR